MLIINKWLVVNDFFNQLFSDQLTYVYNPFDTIFIAIFSNNILPKNFFLKILSHNIRPDDHQSISRDINKHNNNTNT